MSDDYDYDYEDDAYDEDDEYVISREMMAAWVARLEERNDAVTDTVIMEMAEVLAPVAAGEQRPVRHLVLEVLASTRIPEVIPVLHQALFDLDDIRPALAELRYHFVLQVVMESSPLGEQLFRDLVEIMRLAPEEDLRVKAADCLGFTPAAAPFLMEALADESVKVRTSALDRLKTIAAPEAVESLIQLYNRYPEHQAMVLETLGETESDQALDFVLDILANGSLSLKCEAADALSESRDVRALIALCEVLQKDRGELGRVAIKSIGSLLNFGIDMEFISPSVKETVLTTLSPVISLVDEESLEEVVHALGNLGDTRAIPLLAGLLDDADDDLAGEVICALGDFKSPDVLALFIACLDSDDEVRQCAAAKELWNQDVGPVASIVLGHMRSSVFPEDAKADLMTALLCAGSTIPSDLLLAWLEDEHFELREAAFNALWHQPDPAFVDHLLAGLKDEDEDVVVACMKAIGALGDSRTLPPLIAFSTCDEPKLRRRALLVLADVDGFDVMPLLHRATSDPVASVRETAESVIEALNSDDSHCFSRWGSLHYE